MANRRVTPLNDTLIKTVKPKEKDYTLSDGDGLQLLVKAIGSKVWEVRYTINGKTTKTTIGTYPKVSLANARKIRDQYKTTATEGISPTYLKKQKTNTPLKQTTSNSSLSINNITTTLPKNKIPLKNQHTIYQSTTDRVFLSVTEGNVRPNQTRPSNSSPLVTYPGLGMVRCCDLSGSTLRPA